MVDAPRNQGKYCVGVVGTGTGTNYDRWSYCCRYTDYQQGYAKKDAGDYTITASGSTNANYNIYFQPGKFTIKKLDLTITADNKTMILGGVEPEYTVTIAGAVSGSEETTMKAADGEGKVKARKG